MPLSVGSTYYFGYGFPTMYASPVLDLANLEITKRPLWLSVLFTTLATTDVNILIGLFNEFEEFAKNELLSQPTAREEAEYIVFRELLNGIGDLLQVFVCTTKPNHWELLGWQLKVNRSGRVQSGGR